MKPPAFDLSLIPESLPLLMACGGNDDLADLTDFHHSQGIAVHSGVALSRELWSYRLHCER